MRTPAFILRHCRNPFAGTAGAPTRPSAQPQAATPAVPCQAQAVQPPAAYRSLRRLLRQQWEGRMRRPPAGPDQAAAVRVADQAMATVQLHLGCMLDLVADATYADLPSPQRNRIQAEINQHAAAVDHIARTTAVAGVRLLDGSGGWPGAVPLQGAVATVVRSAVPPQPDLRAQTLALHCINAATPASAWAGQLQLEQARAQVAHTRARMATAQLMARLADTGAPAGQRGWPATMARAAAWPLRALRWWSPLRQALRRWLTRGKG